MQGDTVGTMYQGVYETLDELLKGVGLLPLNQVTTRPVLHKAVERAMEVLDRAVKEGRYVVPPRQ
jgi:hypothetical protein